MDRWGYRFPVTFTRDPAKTERINMLNELVLRRAKDVSASEILRAALEWKGDPPAALEIAEHFMHSIADKEGLSRESIHHTTQSVVRTHFSKVLKRLKDDGKLLGKDFNHYRSNWEHEGQVPKMVYIHPERHGKEGWIPHSEWKKAAAREKH